MKKSSKDRAVRIQKFLSQSGIASRRKAEEMLLEGRIKVNGKVVSELGTKIDPEKDVVKVGNKVVRLPHSGVIMLHKPRGVVCTTNDPGGRPTVIDYLPKKYQSYRPVGRLDYESTGLLVLTNDGALSQRLSHPRYEQPRIYEVRVRGHVSERTFNRIERGVKLEDGIVKGKVKLIRGSEASTWLRITIHVGWNRVIRRLMDKLGHPVIKLKRVSHGPMRLGRLKVGEIKKLSDNDYRHLRKKLGLS